MPVSAHAKGSLSADCSGFLNGHQRREDALGSLRVQALIVVHVHVRSRFDLTDGTRLPQTKRTVLPFPWAARPPCGPAGAVSSRRVDLTRAMRACGD